MIKKPAVFIVVIMTSLILGNKLFCQEEGTVNNKLYNELIAVAKEQSWGIVFSTTTPDENINIYNHYSFNSGLTTTIYKDPEFRMKEFIIQISHRGDKAAFWLNEDDGRNSLYIVDINGSNLNKIITLYEGSFVSWSPDDKMIAFGGNLKESDKLGEEGSLYFVDIQTKGIKEIIKGKLGGITIQAWSPDGKEIVYCYRGEMIIYNLITGKSRRIGKGDFPVWSPKGEYIAYLHSESEQVKLMIASVNDGKKTVLAGTKKMPSSITPPIVDGSITAPITWLPNGEYILFCRFVGNDFFENEMGWPFVIKISTKEEEQMPDLLWVFSSWASSL